jgi:hypothetical protein
MWKLRGLDRQLFEGAEAKIFEFLDIEPLMPPARLRLSKLLGRPVMDRVWCYCVAAVTLDEVRGTDLEVHGQTGNAIRFRVGRWEPTFYLDVWRGPARDAPADLVGACLISDKGESEVGWQARHEDAAFGDAWISRHGDDWPFLDTAEDHPALEPLIKKHREWRREWQEQLNDRIEAATNGRGWRREWQQLDDRIEVATNVRLCLSTNACMCQSGLL